MKFKKNHFIVLSLITASAIWGATAPIMKLTLQFVPIFSLAFIRFAAAAIIILPFVITTLKIKKGDFPLILGASLCGVFFNISLFFWGLKLTTALNAGIIIASSPILTILFANHLLREKINLNLIFGATLGIAGITVIIGRNIDFNHFNISPIGDLLILLATLSFVFSEIINKKLLAKYKPMVISFYSFAIGAAGFLPFAIYEFAQNSSWILSLPITPILGIFYGIFFSSFAAYTLWHWGLSQYPASRAGFFFYLDPVVATVVSVILLAEKITFPFVLGALFIFTGMYFVEGRLPYQIIKNILAKNSGNLVAKTE